MTAAAEKGRNDFPAEVKFTTYTLIYSRMKWVQVEGLGQQWERADVDAKVRGDADRSDHEERHRVRFTSPLPGRARRRRSSKCVLDGQTLGAAVGRRARRRFIARATLGGRPAAGGPAQDARISAARSITR